MALSAVLLRAFRQICISRPRQERLSFRGSAPTSPNHGIRRRRNRLKVVRRPKPQSLQGPILRARVLARDTTHLVVEVFTDVNDSRPKRRSGEQLNSIREFDVL